MSAEDSGAYVTRVELALCRHCGHTVEREDPADAWRLSWGPARDAYGCADSAGGHEPAPVGLPGKPSGLDAELRRFLP